MTISLTRTDLATTESPMHLFAAHLMRRTTKLLNFLIFFGHLLWHDLYRFGFCIIQKLLALHEKMNDTSCHLTLFPLVHGLDCCFWDVINSVQGTEDLAQDGGSRISVASHVDQTEHSLLERLGVVSAMQNHGHAIASVASDITRLLLRPRRREFVVFRFPVPRFVCHKLVPLINLDLVLMRIF